MLLSFSLSHSVTLHLQFADLISPFKYVYPVAAELHSLQPSSPLLLPHSFLFFNPSLNLNSPSWISLSFYLHHFVSFYSVFHVLTHFLSLPPLSWHWADTEREKKNCSRVWSNVFKCAYVGCSSFNLSGLKKHNEVWEQNSSTSICTHTQLCLFTSAHLMPCSRHHDNCCGGMNECGQMYQILKSDS